MHRRTTSFLFVLATGLVTWAISERAFWGRIRPDDGIVDSLFTIAAYTVVGYVGLLLARRFAVADARRLLLVGAVVGWVVEGAVVATVYEALPLSLAWTGLAWHAPLSVVVGWHLLPRALRAGRLRALRACTGLGLALGAWSAFMSTDGGDAPDPAGAAVSAGVVAGALALGYLLQARVRPGAAALRPGRVAVAIGVVILAWAGLSVLPAVPFAPLILGPLLWLAWRGLARTASTPEPGADEALAAIVPGVPVRRLGALALVPLLAPLGTVLADATGTAPHLGWAAYIVLMPLGIVAFIRGFRRRGATASPAAVEPLGAPA